MQKLRPPTIIIIIIIFADAANNLAVPTLVAHTDFYNSTLDHLDLMAEKEGYAATLPYGSMI